MKPFAQKNAKALMAALVAWVVGYCLKIIEKVGGVEIPVDIEVALLGLITGYAVYMISNKKE